MARDGYSVITVRDEIVNAIDWLCEEHGFESRAAVIEKMVIASETQFIDDETDKVAEVFHRAMDVSRFDTE